MAGNRSTSYSLVCMPWSILALACTSPSQQAMQGLFWAGPADGGPWLIYLKPGSDSSAAYLTPHTLAVCDLRVFGGGEVSFRTSSTGDGAAYRFVGHWSASGLTGSMRQARTQPGTLIDTPQLDLRRIAATLVSASESISGAYTEASPRRRSSVELVLVDATGGLVGVLVDHDGGAAGIRGVTGVRDGNVLRLSLQSPTRSETDAAHIRGDTLILHGSRLRLVKQSTLPALLFGPNRKECDEGPR